MLQSNKIFLIFKYTKIRRSSENSGGEEFAYLEVMPKTGRTHQIRVHLSAYGNPIVGDNIYSTTKTRAQNKKLGLDRIFLIADYLSFTNLAGARQDYKIDLTDELKNMLKIIK